MSQKRSEPAHFDWTTHGREHFTRDAANYFARLSSAGQSWPVDYNTARENGLAVAHRQRAERAPQRATR